MEVVESRTCSPCPVTSPRVCAVLSSCAGPALCPPWEARSRARRGLGDPAERASLPARRQVRVNAGTPKLPD